LSSTFTNTVHTHTDQSGIPISVPETFADYLRQLISDSGMTMREVARKSGNKTSHATISDIIAGKRPTPGPETLRGLALALGVPPEEMIGKAYGTGKAGDDITELEVARLAHWYKDLPRECQLDLLSLTEALWDRRKKEGRAERIITRREGRKPRVTPTVEPGEDKPNTDRRAG
jgi:transcriptional regulator with XRE-family HTH domain